MPNRSDENFFIALREAIAAHEAVPDDALLAALREALAERDAVPPAFVAAAKAAYAWHDIDAELAQLIYDSQQEAAAAAGLRSESASIRALSFASAHLSIEVEITDESLLGQLIPARPGTVEVQVVDGDAVTVPVDEAGCFTVDPKPGGTFRLRCCHTGHTGHTGTQTDVLTGWVTL
jgi:hypothetical protein